MLNFSIIFLNTCQKEFLWSKGLKQTNDEKTITYLRSCYTIFIQLDKMHNFSTPILTMPKKQA